MGTDASSQSPRRRAKAISGQNSVCSFAVYCLSLILSVLVVLPSLDTLCSGHYGLSANLSRNNHLEYCAFYFTWAAAFTCFGSGNLEWTELDCSAVLGSQFKTVALICCPSRHLIVLVVYLSLPAFAVFSTRQVPSKVRAAMAQTRATNRATSRALSLSLTLTLARVL